MLSHFSRVWLFVTPWTVASRLFCPWDSPGKNTGVAASRGSSWPSDWTCASYISHLGRGLFTTRAPWKPWTLILMRSMDPGEVPACNLDRGMTSHFITDFWAFDFLCTRKWKRGPAIGGYPTCCFGSTCLPALCGDLTYRMSWRYPNGPPRMFFPWAPVIHTSHSSYGSLQPLCSPAGIMAWGDHQGQQHHWNFWTHTHLLRGNNWLIITSSWILNVWSMALK